MRAFIDTPITKERFLYHLKEHQVADSIVQNFGYAPDNFSEGMEFKGCAVGCSLHSIALEIGKIESFGDHFLYEKYLNIPEWLARVQDIVFEGLPEHHAKLWPLKFGDAINVGADLDKIKPAFMIFILQSVLENVKDDKFKEQRDAVLKVIELWRRDDIGIDEWSSARYAADSAAYSVADFAADSVADFAADFAADSAAASAAYSTAYSAARSAHSAAARSAHSAVSYAANSAASAANSAAHLGFADKLLELIRECK
jgi:hypothetical protein